MNVRKRVAITTLALTVAVTGFGSTAAHASSNSWRGESGSHSAKPETSKATITTVVSGTAGQTEPVTVSADGALDYQSQQGAFTVQQPDGKGGVLSTAIIVDGTAVYTQVPEESLALTGGKQWLKTDTAEAGQSLGIDLDMFNSSENPTKGSEMLESVGTEVAEVGKERIRGVTTKHYQVSLDFAAAAENETDETKKESLSKVAALYGNKPLVAEVWLDRKDRIRKLQYSLDLSTLQVPGATEQLTGTIDFTAEFFEFGADVDVTIPSDDEVVTAEEIAAMQTQAAA